MNIIPSHEFITHRVANSMCHQDSGLMDRYVWMADNLTIDPIFCTDKDEVVAKYSILHEENSSLHQRICCTFNLKKKQGLNILMERKLIEEGVS